jgi:hypothetical protein
MPGMEPPPKREQATAQPAGTTEAVTPPGQAAGEMDITEAPGLVMRLWTRYMGADSPYRSLVLVILTLLILVNLKVYLTRAMKRKFKEHAFLAENANSFLKVRWAARSGAKRNRAAAF